MDIRFTAYLDGPRDMTVPWPDGWQDWPRRQRQAWLDVQLDRFREVLVRDTLVIEMQADGRDAGDDDLVSAGTEQELRERLGEA